MREIKFKALDKEAKRIYDVVGINWDENGEITTVFVDNADVIEELLPDDIELLQYIGLKDKNGKEIYEGNIVNINNEVIAIVTWDENNARYYPKIIKEIKHYSDYDIRMYRTNIQWEIIGNIYENPELLKEVQP